MLPRGQDLGRYGTGGMAQEGGAAEAPAGCLGSSYCCGGGARIEDIEGRAGAGCQDQGGWASSSPAFRRPLVSTCFFTALRWIPASWRGFGRGGEGQVPVRDCGERRAITARSPSARMPSVEMSNLLSSNPARRLKEARLPVAAPDALGESDVEPIFGHAQGGGASGSAVPPAAPPSDPIGRGTDQADDSGGGPACEQGVQGFALGAGAGWGHHGRRRRGRKRCQRSQEFRGSPSAPASSSRKVRGDLPRDRAPDAGGPHVDDFGAGRPPTSRPTLSARAWLENRSRLTNYPFCFGAWGASWIALFRARRKKPERGHA